MLGSVLLMAAIPQQLSLRPGLVIATSTHIKKAVYRIPSDDETGVTGAITVRGKSLVVDFGGATLEGTDPKVEPDQRKGTGLVVMGEDITIRNLNVRGYKVGIFAKGAKNLRIINCDASYNWKQRLASTLEREDLSDWMSFHQNDKDEWLRFGAGIYLRDADGAEIRDSRVRGGQCGLMITDTERALIWNNDFSFNSAIGIGMYRSSRNRIMHNKVDWNVRGYSHGVYNRGQDSAGVLVYNQSNENVFAYNSVTHGGDGFFLWAGQPTMDTGQGGSNDNLLYANDFSHAPTNGIEATFSRNTFVRNLILESWHGVWGGYSYNSRFVNNFFGLNAISMAIEHGQNNQIEYNTFYREDFGIMLWQNKTQDPNWGYPKYRDTKSHGYQIENNLFSNVVGAPIAIRDTADVAIRSNTFEQSGELFRLEGETPGLEISGNTLYAKEQPISVSGAKISANNWLADRGSPLPPTMQPSGNPVAGDDPSVEAYLKRFDVGWSPWSAPGKPLVGAADWAARGGKASEQFAVPPLPGGQDPFIPKGKLRGRRYILVDQWGPYDFKSPRLWPRGVGRETAAGGPRTVRRFEVLGPSGEWKVVKATGCTPSALSGRVPGTLEATIQPGNTTNVSIELVYKGAETVDYRGVRTKPGAEVPFGYSEFFVPIAWNVKFYGWQKESSDPRTQPSAFAELLKGRPLAEKSVDRLDFAGGGFAPGVPNDYFATVAEGSFEVPAGEYVIDLLTDDGARLWLDGQLIVADAWKYQGPTLYSVKRRLSGTHKLRVEHFQIDGYAALKVAIRPAGKP